jgi:hypothetical protein
MMTYDADLARVVASSQSRNKLWRMIHKVFTEYDILVERRGPGCPTDEDFQRALQFAKHAVGGAGFVEGYYAALDIASLNLPARPWHGLYVPSQVLVCRTAGGLHLTLRGYFGERATAARRARERAQPDPYYGHGQDRVGMDVADQRAGSSQRRCAVI